MNEQQVAWDLAAGKASFLRGDPDPIASASAAFTYAYRTEKHIREIEESQARNLDALYEISRYLKMPAESAAPCVAVPREVRERYDRMLDALARLAGAFSAVVRNTPGRMVTLTGHDTGNPLSFPAYAEAMRIINGEKP